MDHSIAAKYAARPAARFVRPSTRVRERRLGLRPSGSFQAPGARIDRAARPRGRAAGPAAGQLACDPAGRRPTAPPTGRPRPSVTMEWARSGAPARPAARAPRRRRGAPEDLDRHLRRRHRRPLRAGTALARRRQPPARARRPDVDAAQGHARTPARRREETALREVEEETGLEVRITGALDSIEYWFVQSGTRIHKTVHYFLMEPTGGDLAAHDHEFDEVRWIPFDTRRDDADLRDRAGPRRPGGPADARSAAGPDAVRRGGLVTDAGRCRRST